MEVRCWTLDVRLKYLSKIIQRPTSKTMIIIKLHGGLGNQLFQYAFAKALAKRLNTNFCLDISFFEHQNPVALLLRNYALNFFAATMPIATKADIQAVCGSFSGWYVSPNLTDTRLRKQLSRAIGLPHYVAEPHFEYADLLPKNNAYYEGYWQSERYFKTIESELRADLQFREPLEPAANAWLKQIQNSNSVCLHVRRGDYLALSNYVVLAPNYYQKAVQLLQNQTESPAIFVFSDDLAWCHQNLRFAVPTVFIPNFVNLRSEFELMCRCQHHITANSSLSWWAAWLNPNPEKMVIAPETWFNDGRNSTDLLPANWIKLG